MSAKIKFVPIVKMLIVTVVVALAIVFISNWFKSFPDSKFLMENSWFLATAVHIPQFLIPFVIILLVTKGKIGLYGFNAKENPPVFTHKRMLFLGIAFGLFFSLRYIPQIIRHSAISISMPVTFVSVVGNMAFQWIIVGVSEETMFRGLIQTYLMKNLEGNVQMLGHDLHIGTVIGAIFWGAFHFINILIMPMGSVIFYVILTTAIGLAMGYAYQKTGSLLTTIIVHNTIFGVPLTIGYILYWLL